MQTPKTAVLETFTANLEQSILLAQAVRRGGLYTLLQPFGIVRAIATRDTTRLENVNTLARDTAPAVLLTYLITIFEAYWENLVLLICHAEPSLLDRLEREVRQQTKAGTGIEERVRMLFQNRRYDTISAAIWEAGIGIPFATICHSANTTPSELDRAKALRNLHIHRQGRADRQYIERVSATSIGVGDPVPIPIELAVATMHRLRTVALHLDRAAVARFPVITQPEDTAELATRAVGDSNA